MRDEAFRGMAWEEKIRGVHAAQDSIFHRPIYSGDRLRTVASLIQVRRIRPGAFILTKFETHDDRTGEPVVTSYASSIYRGVEIEGEDACIEEAPSVPQTAQNAAAMTQLPIPIAREAPHVYTECAQIWSDSHRAASRLAGGPAGYYSARHRHVGAGGRASDSALCTGGAHAVAAVYWTLQRHGDSGQHGHPGIWRRCRANRIVFRMQCRRGARHFARHCRARRVIERETRRGPIFTTVSSSSACSGVCLRAISRWIKCRGLMGCYGMPSNASPRIFRPMSAPRCFTTRQHGFTDSRRRPGVLLS